jgi:DNA primase
MHDTNRPPAKRRRPLTGRLVFDLDPAPIAFDRVVAAIEMRKRLENLGLVSFSTGGKGPFYIMLAGPL